MSTCVPRGWHICVYVRAFKHTSRLHCTWYVTTSRYCRVTINEFSEVGKTIAYMPFGTHDNKFPGDEGLDLGVDGWQLAPGVHVVLLHAPTPPIYPDREREGGEVITFDWLCAQWQLNLFFALSRQNWGRTGGDGTEMDVHPMRWGRLSLVEWLAAHNRWRLFLSVYRWGR